MSLDAYLASRREIVDRALDRLLPPPEGPAATVASAMRYAVLGGGKRLRPAVVLASCEACGGPAEAAIDPAAAIEMIHTYSLIHDDLPAMDDDDLRRGRPTVHRAFGEAEAILAGDGLLTLAFEILASEPNLERSARAVVIVARRAGLRGMVGGQMADLEAERSSPDARGLEWIHRHKTGALFAASAELGALYAGAEDDARAALARYGEALGLAFQIQDDILDGTATARDLGKTPGKDRAAGKATYPALLGMQPSRREASRLVDVALREIEGLGPEADPLRELARVSISRSG